MAGSANRALVPTGTGETLYNCGIPDGQTGNPNYAINLSSAQPNALAFLILGTNAANVALPLDVGIVLGANFAGCMAETDLAVGVVAIADAAGSASATVPIPGGGGLSGAHIYGQWLVFDTGVGSTSNALDINIE